MQAVKKRCDVLKEDTWALERIYENEDLWEKDFELARTMAEDFVKYKGHLQDSPLIWKEAIDQETKIGLILQRVIIYASMRYHQDMADAKYQALYMRCMQLGAEVSEKCSFLSTELLQLDEEEVKRLTATKEYALYKRMMEELFRKKPHILSAEVESILAASSKATDGASNTYATFTNSDLSFDLVKDSEGNVYPLTDGRLVHYLESSDREFRMNTYETYYKVYKQFKNTFATLMASNVNQEAFYAKVRSYASSRQASMAANDIPEEVYDSLIEAVHKYMPSMHRFVGIRKKMLKVEELHMYDVYVPLVEDAAVDIPFEKAKEMVLEGLKPLGEEYLSIVKKGFDERWIDVYENEGKRSGAYSWGAYDTDPYVLLNYNNNLDSVFTLAHEMGHSLHSYYTHKAQPALYGNYCLFVAEVASTCNEALLIHHLLKVTTDKKQRMYLLNHFMDQYKGTIYRQTMFAEFERNIHNMAAQNVALTADVISNEYLRLNKEYFGEEMIMDDNIAMEWARIPHFYTPFYVYQYATGFSAALAIANRILKYGDSAVCDYKKFLSGGDTLSPIDLLKLAGVDMATPKPVEEALEYFGTLLDEFEALMDE